MESRLKFIMYGLLVQGLVNAATAAQAWDAKKYNIYFMATLLSISYITTALIYKRRLNDGRY